MILHPPVAVALARRSPRLPRAAGWAFEPKWDGWRVIVIRDERGVVTLQARSGRLLTTVLPDLAAAAGRELPTGVVLDGEAVAAGPDGRVTFAAMQRRGLASPRNAARLARTTAVAYAAFDLLELRGTDTRPRPYRDRRAALLELLPAGRTAAVLQAVPATEDLDVAAGWWAAWETAPGVEGIIAKRTRGPYRPGKRDWVKVKYPNSRGG